MPFSILFEADALGALLPNDLPPWKTVYHNFRQWRLDGTWETIHTALRERLRQKLGRNAQPSAGIVDSQSVKTTAVGGFVAMTVARRSDGRKQHIVVR